MREGMPLIFGWKVDFAKHPTEDAIVIKMQEEPLTLVFACRCSVSQVPQLTWKFQEQVGRGTWLVFSLCCVRLLMQCFQSYAKVCCQREKCITALVHLSSRYLSMFTKATPLAGQVSLSMSPNHPMIVEYNINDFGHVR